ncbi:hypothetical protein [uncultured Algoriphagus sp.]|uniref:hypothetical protein n=1 Tax=uncultured Algoriphagus sp. TaxID=417365 RepID=UPI0030EC007F
MINSTSILHLQSLGRFIQFFINPASFLAYVSNSGIEASNAEKEESKPISPNENIPLPNGDEINPNKEVPEEEEYLPDEQEVPVEDPPKEIEEDPYFPRKGDGLPPEEGEEFPKTDPI